MRLRFDGGDWRILCKSILYFLPFVEFWFSTGILLAQIVREPGHLLGKAELVVRNAQRPSCATRLRLSADMHVTDHQFLFSSLQSPRLSSYICFLFSLFVSPVSACKIWVLINGGRLRN